METLKRVRKAMPKLSKVAWRLRPSHGLSSEHSERGPKKEEEEHHTPVGMQEGRKRRQKKENRV